jgi:hypothetical protein
VIAMIRVFGFAAAILCVISLVLLGAMTLLAPHVSPTAEMASARMLQNNPNWFQLLDLDRALSVHIGVPLDDEIRDVRLIWDDGKYAYFWTWKE